MERFLVYLQKRKARTPSACCSLGERAFMSGRTTKHKESCSDIEQQDRSRKRFYRLADDQATEIFEKRFFWKRLTKDADFIESLSQ